MSNNEKVCESYSVVRTTQGLFLFKTREFSGMAGETCAEHEAWELDTKKGKMKCVPYERLREVYRKIKYDGRTTRIKFWFAMKPFSPKGREEEERDQHAEVIRRII